MDSSTINIKVQKWVAMLSVGLLGIKLIAFYITSSVAILTDALEGIVNIVAGFVGLYSLYISAKPRDDDHPYGHGKVEFVSAGFEGSLIFIAGLFIIYHAVQNLLVPVPIQKLDVGMVLICFTALVNYVMGWYCIRVGKRNKSAALTASGKHLQSDTYTTVGIVVGLTIVFYTGVLWLDSVVAIVFALWIMRTGYMIIRTAMAGILDESDTALMVEIVKVLNNNRRDNWMDVHNLRIIKYGRILHIDCHLTLPWYLNMHEAHLEIDEFTGLIKQHFGTEVEFYIHTDGCLEFSCLICSKKDCAVRQHPQERKVEWSVENVSTNRKHGPSPPG